MGLCEEVQKSLQPRLVKGGKGRISSCLAGLWLKREQTRLKGTVNKPAPENNGWRSIW